MIADLLLWVVIAECLAWAWFLIAWPTFAAWPDRAFGLSKAAGVLMLSASVWTLTWAGALTITRWSCQLIAGALLCAAAFAFHRRRASVVQFLRRRPADWLAAETVWLVTMVAFVLIRARNPAIAGGEKFMDAAFLNAAMRSTTLPLYDPWLSGFPANYYYFGYVTWAIVSRVLGTPPAVAYNLAVASVPAAVAAGAYSIGLVLTQNRWLAVSSSLALTWFGTLAAVRQVAAGRLPMDTWSPTRVIPGTINEFPFFTFFWGDLHPHLLAMPAFLVALGLALAALEEESAGARSAAILALLGTAAGLSFVTSTWDVLPLGIVIAVVLAVRARRFGIRQTAWNASPAVAGGLITALPPMLQAQAGGLSAGFASSHSPIGAFLLVQGIWMLPAVVLLAATLAGRWKTPGTAWLAGCAAAAAVLGAILTGSVTVAALAALTILAWTAFLQSHRKAPWLFVATAVTLLLTSECLYIDDIYGRALERMNIVFKLHLHAILLLGVTSGTCVQMLWRLARSRARRAGMVAGLAAAAVLACVYPAGAIASLLMSPPAFGLDGTRYLAVDHPGDLELISFLNREVRGAPVIAEAAANPYSYSSRISSNTGLPTILGWANHERVWRRHPDAVREIERRAAAVRTLYEGDAQQAAEVLMAFHVRYVVVGAFERDTYPSGDFAKFDTMSRRVFDAGGTQLFEIDGVRTAP